MNMNINELDTLRAKVMQLLLDETGRGHIWTFDVTDRASALADARFMQRYDDIKTYHDTDKPYVLTGPDICDRYFESPAELVEILVELCCEGYFACYCRLGRVPVYALISDDGNFCGYVYDDGPAKLKALSIVWPHCRFFNLQNLCFDQFDFEKVAAATDGPLVDFSLNSVVSSFCESIHSDEDTVTYLKDKPVEFVFNYKLNTLKGFLKTIQKLKTAIRFKNITQLEEILWYQNKYTRKAFTVLTGIKLGATDKSMKAALAAWIVDNADLQNV